MKIISRAPCRVDLAGGTLDIWPLYLYHPGAVTVNFAVDRCTTCTIDTNHSPEIDLHSLDLGAQASFPSMEELRLAPGSKLPLATHVLRFFPVTGGLTMRTNSEAPAGAGISGSS